MCALCDLQTNHSLFPGKYKFNVARANYEIAAKNGCRYYYRQADTVSREIFVRAEGVKLYPKKGADSAWEINENDIECNMSKHSNPLACVFTDSLED